MGCHIFLCRSLLLNTNVLNDTIERENYSFNGLLP